MKKACLKINDSTVWTLTYDDVASRENTIHIYNFDSQDNDGYMFHSTLPSLEIVEDTLNGKTVVVGAVIDSVKYEVDNPLNFLEYKLPL